MKEENQKKKNKEILKYRKQRKGIVISDNMNKTIIISEIRKVKHKYYGKSILRKKKYMVHDEKNISKNGDYVSIMETRPMSKKKCWRLVAILENSKK
ncbi:30S ribosomal protein S17 [Blattabacterium cuenoti]|uniref:30S ribosomal protein S17 n=1 Tax=Blattabacterium cuenoti TaxID=1653831 RepID=UPI00293BBD05|nr:30S ribosomal protein S17 [Blattabacterium cuenoti]